MPPVFVMPRLARAIVPTLLTLLLLIIAHAALATDTPQFTALAGFAGSNGASRAALVAGPDGSLYGTTVNGGTNSGTIFKITLAGTLTTLHTFSATDSNGINSDGAYSQAALVTGPDGNFYGTTYEGGTNGSGTVFKITPDGTLTTLHAFAATDSNGINSDGAYPEAALVAGADGDFYGTTYRGGANGKGTVFQITPDGTLTTLHAFAATDSNGINSDGAYSQAALVMGADGDFYGTTSAGGANGKGTVFKITPAGTLTILHTFGTQSGDGMGPVAALVTGADGTFYGTAAYGGAYGAGTVFKITPSGALTTLHTFSAASNSYPYPNSDGADPLAALIAGPDGDFYGTTAFGGANGSGTVFQITPSGTLTTLHTFSATDSNGINSDGAYSQAALVTGPDGNFYGTTYEGGTNGIGTVFEVIPVKTLTTLHTFSSVNSTGENSDGAFSQAALVVGPDGDFYGTTEEGGINNRGTVFKITPAGTLTTLYTFSATNSNNTNNDGAFPYASLVAGQDGNFYGTTYIGGVYGNGTVFKITPSGTLTTLYTFSATIFYGNSDGAYPGAALVMGADGDFYGTAAYGGAYGAGTVFKITPAGTLTILHTFGPQSGDGAHPLAALIAGADGDFYGTASGGGANDNGTVFKITPSGALTTLHTFSAASNSYPYPNSDGAFPYASLVAGADGDFYGTASGGGVYGKGTVFKITPSGTLTTLYTFSARNGGGSNSDGATPYAALVLGSDGDFYGTTLEGGTSGSGTVFQITPSGTLTTLYSFSAPNSNYENSDGAEPQAALVAGPDGAFYGTTIGAGADGEGTVFRLSILASAPTWAAVAVGAGQSGTGRILWDRSDGAAGLWVLGANDAQSAVGATYGPYPGWTAKAVATANDGTSRVLWTNTNGMAGVWTFNAQGVETTIGTTYGPYSGWTAQSVGVASDGTSRVLWTNTNGMAGVWSFNTADVETIIGATYGPYSGWAAKSLATAADGTSRVLWDRSDGAAGVWTFNASDVKTVVGTVYGPYTGWTAKSIGAASDGTSRVLWTNVNGEAGVWTFNTADVNTTIGATYGPYSGYSAGALATASDGTSRVLWNDVSRAAGAWSFNTSDVETVIGTTYGPF